MGKDEIDVIEKAGLKKPGDRLEMYVTESGRSVWSL